MMNVSIVALGEFLFAIVGLIASGLLNLLAMAVGMTAGLVIGVIVMMLALPVIFEQSLRWAYADVMQDKKRRLTSYYLRDLTLADIRKREKKYVLLYGTIMVLPTLVFLYLTFEVDTRIYISVMEGLHVTFAAYSVYVGFFITLSFILLTDIFSQGHYHFELRETDERKLLVLGDHQFSQYIALDEDERIVD